MGAHIERVSKPPPVFLEVDDKLVIFDGVCKFCHFWSRFIIRFDSSQRIKLATVQSPVGIALFEHYSLTNKPIESVYYFSDGKHYEKSTAMLKIAEQLPWPWQSLLIFRVIPRPIRDAVYSLIARNRYRLFGRYAQCPLPTAAQQARYFVLGKNK
ncbi:thiol-disulfide oxidoreductase DCC family protein [Zhongshania sp.]|uniref:thiol-disulfide oxidoreductase DCC family protein n=1 Tax=Zhongshania sp. TaxID=1971902 RepID=UPI0035664ABF